MSRENPDITFVEALEQLGDQLIKPEATSVDHVRLCLAKLIMILYVHETGADIDLN